MSLCIVTGIHTSGLRNATTGPKKPGSATPITVSVAPPTISSPPMIRGSRSKRRSQYASLITITGFAPGAVLSRGSIRRPARARWRSTWKNSPETSCTMLRSAAAASVRRGRRTCMLVGLVAAKASARPPISWRSCSNTGHEYRFATSFARCLSAA